MNPRRRQGRISQSKRPTDQRHSHAPYAVGEDVGASFGRKPTTPHAHSARARLRSTTSSAWGRIPAGDEALAPAEASRTRWRHLSPVQTRLASLASTTRAGASRTARATGGLLKRVTAGATLSVGIPLALLLALLAWLFTSSYWQARAVRIQGTSDPTLLALVHAQRLTGCNAFRCDFSAAQQAIAASPLVQKVSVTIMYPETTVVSITQRQTVALWRTQSQRWAIGADGVIIGAVEQARAQAGAAVVEDPGGAAFAGRAPQPGMRMDAALVTMASQLRMKATGAGLDPTSLRYSAQDGFTLRANGGALVVFGGPADALATLADVGGSSPAPALRSAPQPTQAQISRGAQMQVEAAAAILTRLAQAHASASLIDVRWGTHPYYR